MVMMIFIIGENKQQVIGYFNNPRSLFRAIVSGTSHLFILAPFILFNALPNSCLFLEAGDGGTVGGREEGLKN